MSYGGRAIVVKNNDRPNCKLHPDVIDLSTIAFKTLAPLSKGRMKGEYVALGAVSKSLSKQYIPTNSFSSQDILLNENIPNIYLAGETIHISGKTTDGKMQSLLYFILPNGENMAISQDNANGTEFSFDLPLMQTGKYRMTVSSGFDVRDVSFVEIQVLDPSVFQGKKLFSSDITAIQNINMSRYSYKGDTVVNVVHLPAGEYHVVTISQ